MRLARSSSAALPWRFWERRPLRRSIRQHSRQPRRRDADGFRPRERFGPAGDEPDLRRLHWAQSWNVLQEYGGVDPIPGVKKNSILLNYVLSVGSDGYEVAFSGGEISPNFGGGGTNAPYVANALYPGGAPLTLPARLASSSRRTISTDVGTPTLSSSMSARLPWPPWVQEGSRARTRCQAFKRRRPTPS